MMIKVRNLKDQPLGLKNGIIPPNGEGYAERAEVETLYRYLEVIHEKETQSADDAEHAEPGQETILLKKRGRPRNV